ncbi:hypothetical protein EDB87DRAFT_1672288 [Lactarius vividus]|nr:hypothetical protein EDB87DRAFT_1672288 [Lactarius vividus]
MTPPIDAYSRGQGDVDSDRNALFSGYNPEKVTGRFAHDGPTLHEPAPGEHASSKRNALRMVRQAEETARNTINRLGGQSEKLANTKRHLDLNRSIFRPAITFKDAKRAAQEAKVLQRYEEERENAMGDICETQNRLGPASTYGSREEVGAGPNGRRAAQQSRQKGQKEQRRCNQFEATASDDELENELDDNLDEISDVAKILKALGTAMGQELDHQNNRIEREGCQSR